MCACQDQVQSGSPMAKIDANGNLVSNGGFVAPNKGATATEMAESERKRSKWLTLAIGFGAGAAVIGLIWVITYFVNKPKKEETTAV